MTTIGSFLLDGNTFEIDFSVTDELPSSLPSTPPKHHRTSSISDTPASSTSGGSISSGSAALSPNGCVNPASNSAVLGSLNGGSNNSSSNGGSSHSSGSNMHGSTDGGAVAASAQQHPFGNGRLGITMLDLPDFAWMLPSECSFSESTADDYAAAPTPHTPVVPSGFEGQGLEAASARSSGHAASSSHHPGFPDEFDSTAMEVMSHDSTHGSGSSSNHGLNHGHRVQDPDIVDLTGWDPVQYALLLAEGPRRLSVVPEDSDEGQDEEPQLEPEEVETQQLVEQDLVQRQLQEDHAAQQQCQQQAADVQLDAHQHPRQQQQQQQCTPSAMPDLQRQLQLLQPSEQDSQSNCVGQGQEEPAAAAGNSGILLVSGRLHSSRTCSNANSSSSGSSCVQLPTPVSAGHEECACGAPPVPPQQQQCMEQPLQQLQADCGCAESAAAAAAAVSQGGLLCLGKSGADATQSRIHSSKGENAVGANTSCINSTAAAGAVTGDDSAAEAAAAAVTTAAAAAAAAEEDEWAAANRERLREQQQQGVAAAAAGAAAAPSGLLTYPQAEAALLATDISCHRGAVLQSLPPRPGWLKRNIRQWLACGVCQAPTAVGREGSPEHEQLVLLLCLAKTPLSDDSAVHLGILQAVYCALTGKQQPVPRYGHHWGDVGFQGDDPATDLRGVGMLGLLQLLYLPHHHAAATEQLYHLSVSRTQDFPLAIVSLNITRWTLTALRAGHLAQHARQLGSYAAAANAFYCGVFYEFYARWCQGKTMRDSGFVLKQLEEYCRTHPAKLLRLAAAPDAAMAAADKLAWQP